MEKKMKELKKLQKNEILQEILKDFDLEDFDSDLDMLRQLEAVLCDGEALAELEITDQEKVEEAYDLVVEAIEQKEKALREEVLLATPERVAQIEKILNR